MAILYEKSYLTSVKAQIIEKNGKKEFVVPAYRDYLKLQADLEDYEDLRCLRAAKAAEQDADTISLDEVKRQIRGTSSPARLSKPRR